MAGEIVFIIKPNPNACSRCKQVGYVNGRDDSEGFNVHVAQAGEFKMIHPVHPHCRCEVEVLDIVVDSIKEKEEIENFLSEEKDKVHLSPDVLGGFRPSPIRDTEKLFYKGSARQLISYHHRFRRQPGSFFFTVISEVAATLIKELSSLFNRFRGIR